MGYVNFLEGNIRCLSCWFLDISLGFFGSGCRMLIFPSKIGSQRISMLKFWVEEPRKLIATKAAVFFFDRFWRMMMRWCNDSGEPGEYVIYNIYIYTHICGYIFFCGCTIVSCRIHCSFWKWRVDEASILGYPMFQDLQNQYVLKESILVIGTV